MGGVNKESKTKIENRIWEYKKLKAMKSWLSLELEFGQTAFDWFACNF